MSRRLKRLIDVVVAVTLLVAAAPVLAAAAAAVALTMGRPVLFRQVRPGLHARLFTLLKFRTMRDDRGPDGSPLPDAQRLTRLGGALRRTSLDELPQLWNVLRGELSLVGPRPLLPEYLALYTPEQARRHDVKPGVTGWAQVCGRNTLTWEEKFRCDLWYVDNWSLWLDFKILGLTAVKVVRRDGVAEPAAATATPFRGSPGVAP
jgi:lipopolysaccharide/colanic/teichoic acid biosynthesis glycosyltransferase